jgi:uncharacterized protein
VASSEVAAERLELKAGDLAKAFSYATEWLGVYVDEVNALNVYPVPDGDTGTNMHLTMQSVRRQLEEEKPSSMSEVAHALAYGSLLGARGNSGVILSQILKGFADAVRDKEALDAEDIAAALESASRCSYAAVMKPVEGTILTVMRASHEGAREDGAASALEVFKAALKAGYDALEKTPEMLPVLKQAGVVDAGGLGLLRILEGLIAAYEDRELPPPPEIKRRAQEQFEEEEFGYCTEFLLADAKAPTEEIQRMVQDFGDSLLVVGAEGYVKGHIHTEEPEKLLALVGRYGTMVRSKVEDMSEQHSEILAGAELGEVAPPETALVAVSAGYGVTKVFRSLGARVVAGGQTNNPSVQDIADAVRSVGARNVIILPNNKNVIMAAERVGKIVAEKHVHVLPTRSLGQGLAAAVVFSEESDPEELLEEMEEASGRAVTLEVTRASRDAHVHGVKVKEGMDIGLVDGRLKVSGESPEGCLVELLGEVTKDDEDYEIGTLFYGPAISRERAEALLARLEEAFGDLELELHGGGPDLYAYVMALE